MNIETFEGYTNILSDVVEYLARNNDYSFKEDALEEIKTMTPREIINIFLCENGIIGYSDMFMDLFEFLTHVYESEGVPRDDTL